LLSQKGRLFSLGLEGHRCNHPGVVQDPEGLDLLPELGIAKDYPEFMDELVDKIIELIRKDFMKSGI
jgi:hypothetical protein